MKKWTVRKRDGVWVVLDSKGELRYAAAEHRMALAFATTRPKDEGHMFVFPHHPSDYGSSWDEILRRMWERRPDSDDGR